MGGKECFAFLLYCCCHYCIPVYLCYYLCISLLLSLHIFAIILYTSRVAWVFGNAVRGPIEETTPTFLTPNVLATLREVDDIAHRSLIKYSESSSQQCLKILY